MYLRVEKDLPISKICQYLCAQKQKCSTTFVCRSRLQDAFNKRPQFKTALVESIESLQAMLNWGS